MQKSVLSLVVLLGVVAGIYSAEVYFAFMGKSTAADRHASNIAQWKKAGTKYDPRTKMEVVHDLRRNGIRAYPKVNPGSLIRSIGKNSQYRSLLSIDGKEILPLSGLARTRVVLCNETGRWLTYDSDERGFHNPPKTWESGKIDIAVVGDSFGEGACVSSHLNAVARIRTHYPRTLNLSMGGSGPLLELAALSEYLPGLRPRVVLWFFFAGNDLRDLTIEAKAPLLMRYLDDGFSQNLERNRSKIDLALQQFAEAEIEKAVQNSKKRNVDAADIILLRTLRNKIRSSGILVEQRDKGLNEALVLFKRILVVASRRVQSWGGQIIFVYLPSGRQFREAKPKIEELGFRDEIFKFVNDIGITVLDIEPELRKLKNPAAMYALKTRSHFNREGYSLVARTIMNSGVLGMLPPGRD